MKNDDKLNINDKNYQLFIKQIQMLKDFRAKGAISEEQFQISYYGLINKTGYIDNNVS